MKKFNEIKETAIDKLVEFEEKHPKASKVLKTVDTVLPIAAAFAIGIITEKAIDDAKYGNVRCKFREELTNERGDKTYVYGYTPTVRELKRNGRFQVTRHLTMSTDDDFASAKEEFDKEYGLKD